MNLLPETCQTSDDEIKRKLEAIFDQFEVRIVPDGNDPFNLDKAMVYVIYDDPYADMFIKLRPNERSS